MAEPAPKLTEVEKKALCLLAEHGNGDVWAHRRTCLEGGVPAINLSSARTLDQKGLVTITRWPETEAWGGIAITDRGRRVAAGA